MWRGWYLELGGALLWLLEGVELLLRQELRPRVDGELARVLHVGGGAPAPVHGGPQRGLVHDISCEARAAISPSRGGCWLCPQPPRGPFPPLVWGSCTSQLPAQPLPGASLATPSLRGPSPSSDPLFIPHMHAPWPRCPHQVRGRRCGAWALRAG